MECWLKFWLLLNQLSANPPEKAREDTPRALSLMWETQGSKPLASAWPSPASAEGTSKQKLSPSPPLPRNSALEVSGKEREKHREWDTEEGQEEKGGKREENGKGKGERKRRGKEKAAGATAQQATPLTAVSASNMSTGLSSNCSTSNPSPL